jgi:hypothetical protein
MSRSNNIKALLKIKEQQQQEEAINRGKNVPSSMPLSDKTQFELNPLMPSAIAIGRLTGKDDTTAATDVLNELLNQFQNAQDGNSRELEAILHSQAIALNVAFSVFLTKLNHIANEPGLLLQKPELLEGFGRLAFKCQDQSRKTILALNELRNPKKPTQFIKNYVNQQLNQLQVEQQEIKKQLEVGDAPVDFGNQRETATVDNAKPTVGEIDRAKD